MLLKEKYKQDDVKMDLQGLGSGTLAKTPWF
jgi:hypothetical protein